MANTKSAKKRARQTIKKTARNRKILSTIKTALKAARTAKSTKKVDSTVAVKKAVSTIMKAASKGTLHKKTAARYVSRLTKA